MSGEQEHGEPQLMAFIGEIQRIQADPPENNANLMRIEVAKLNNAALELWNEFKDILRMAEDSDSVGWNNEFSASLYSWEKKVMAEEPNPDVFKFKMFLKGYLTAMRGYWEIFQASRKKEDKDDLIWVLRKCGEMVFGKK